jgi:hypothetical protein
MARKRKESPAAQAQPQTQTSPVSNGPPPGEGQPPAEVGAGQQAAKPATKKEAVQLALAAGVSSPTEIAVYVKRTFNVDMTPEHVSTIKGILKRPKKGAGKKAGPGRKKKAQQSAEQPQQPPARTRTASPAAGPTAQDLILLAELAARAGGFERLRQFVAALGGLR